MIRPLSVRVPLIRLAAAGTALGIGWQLGSYLAAVLIGARTIDFPAAERFRDKQQEEPFWRREFRKISKD